MNGINGGYGQNLMQMAVQSFMQSGNMMTQGPQLSQASPMKAMMRLASSFMQGMGQAFGQHMLGAGNMQAPGFLSPPSGMGAGMAQQANNMTNMMGPWNQMGNLLNGGGGQQHLGALAGQFAGNAQQIQGLVGQLGQSLNNIAGLLNQLNPQMAMQGQLNQAMQATNMGGPLAQTPGMMPGMGAMPGMNPNPGMNPMPGVAPGMGAPGTGQIAPNQGFQFPGAAGSDFLGKLPADKGGVAKALNVGGKKDVERINNAVGKLKTAKPELKPAGQAAAGGANLELSPAQVDAIRQAPDMASAKKLVLDAMGKKAGVDLTDINMGDKKGIRNDKYRQAANKLLGKNIRKGTEKNSGSALLIDSMAESVAKSVKGGTFGSQTIQSPGGIAFGGFGGGFNAQSMQAGMQGMGGMTNQHNNMGGFAQGIAPGAENAAMNGEMGGFNNAWCGTGAAQAAGMSGSFGGFGAWLVPGYAQEVPNPSAGISVGLGQFAGAADEVGKLASPLIFDLEGTGLQLKDEVRMIAIDIDGDGGLELVTDLDAELGLLVFDSSREGITELSGKDMFGDNTDLTKYGIKADTEDGAFKDGFQALRALCEHFKLVDARKQHLDSSDLAFLEENVGLRMRVGGMDNGEQRTFDQVGVSQINLGNPAQTQHIDDAAEDRWGNKIMLQDGATFTVHNEVRAYADIWFKIQARYEVTPEENLKVDLAHIQRSSK